MESVRRFLAILGADLLARFRSNGFWALVAVSAALTWLCFPPAGSSYIVVGVNGHYRGFYSSAWIGMVLAMVSGWVSLIGFYLVRGTLRRDIETNVWQLLVATPLSRPAYLLAKWCSHMLVLGLIVCAGLVVGLAAQLVRAEDPNLDLLELVKPSLVIALPSLALSAMFAIWFDMVPWLRRSAGNVLYFVIWVLILVGSAQTIGVKGPAGWPGDPRGMKLFDRAVHEQVLIQTKKVFKPGFCIGCSLGERPVERFNWTSWQVTPDVLLGRLSWLALAVLGVAMTAPWLDRAAAHRGSVAGPGGQSDGGRRMAWLAAVLRPLQRFSFGSLLAAELQLTLRERKLWWWCVWLVLAAAQLVAPLELAALAVIAAWAISLDMYARAVLREQETGSAPVVFCSANAGHRILLARWMSLLVIGCVSTLPALLRFGAMAPVSAAAIALVGVSLATWALALGAITRTSRTYELAMCVLAYVGLQKSPVLHVLVAPGWTVSAHLIMLPVAALLLWVAWPRLYPRVA